MCHKSAYNVGKYAWKRDASLNAWVSARCWRYYANNKLQENAIKPRPEGRGKMLKCQEIIGK
jgi:hypothetical protein